MSAKLSSARILESQGKLNEARNLYADIIRSNPNSALATDANLRLMELGATSSVSASTNAASILVKP
ncbi:MAG: hypothetical protein WDM76_05690 [Limisphaerales bacterium]